MVVGARRSGELGLGGRQRPDGDRDSQRRADHVEADATEAKYRQPPHGNAVTVDPMVSVTVPDDVKLPVHVLKSSAPPPSFCFRMCSSP